MKKKIKIWKLQYLIWAEWFLYERRVDKRNSAEWIRDLSQTIKRTSVYHSELDKIKTK